MNILAWVVAGALLGWIGHRFLNVNADRNPLMVAVIGGLGGLLGGTVVAPMLLGSTSAAGPFNAGAMGFALLVAAAALYVGDFVADRFGV